MTQAARDCLTVASQDNPSGREFLPDAWCRGRLKSDQLGGRSMAVMGEAQVYKVASSLASLKKPTTMLQIVKE